MNAAMGPSGFEFAVILGTILIPLIKLAICAVVGYFVVRRAVRDALRDHERTGGGSGANTPEGPKDSGVAS